MLTEGLKGLEGVRSILFKGWKWGVGFGGSTYKFRGIVSKLSYLAELKQFQLSNPTLKGII